MIEPAAVHRALAALHEHLLGLGSVAVAYSGGVDSTLLLAAAQRALGPRALAVFGRSPTVPGGEESAALALAAALGARVRVVETCEMEDPAFVANGPDRCFHCKRGLFALVRAVADEEGLAALLEGSNADDLGDFRPGSRAAREAGALAPLLELGIHKPMVRAMARALGLPNWDKPAMACLSSRVPYGRPIARATLARIDAAERALVALGLGRLRVRDHGDVARLEVDPAEIPRLTAEPLRAQVVEALRAAGFRYVALDLSGYRTGAMNEVLPATDLRRPL
ncbi:MAG: ATP-dependent sacrificial sulfur transferase LarE [Pseudomonadota bacterium]